MGVNDERDVGGAGVAQGVSVVAVHVLDPYVMLVLSNGQVALLVLDATEGQFVAADVELSMESGGVTAACLFYWRPSQGMGFQAGKAEREEYEAALAAAVVEDEQAKDDEETLLYDEEARDLLAAEGGDGVESNGPSATVEGEVDMEVSDDVDVPSEHEGGGGDGVMNGHVNGFADGGVYCALCRRDGMLEVVSLPSFHRVFMTRRVPIGPRILRNAVLFPDLPCFRKRAPDYQHDTCSVQDIRISTIGPADGEASSVVERVVMALWTSDEDLLVYAAQRVNGAAAVDKSALPWSFVRVQHDLITRPPRRAAPVGGSSASVLHTFDNIAGQAGMIVGGQRPACVLAERGQVTVHALNVRDTYTTLPLPPSDRVLAFAPFTDCDNGFLVVHGGVTGPLTLSLCSLDANTALGLTSATGVLAGARATARKVGPLGMEVRKIVALDGTRVPCYAVSAAPAGGAVDEMEEERERAEEAAAAAAAAAAGEGDDEDDPDAGPRGTSLEELNDWTKASDEYLGRPPLPGLWSSGGHQIWVMGGAPLRIMSTVSLKKGERCLSLGLYKVRRRYGLSVYLVAGTATLVRRGEDTMCPGRLIVYRINKGSDDKVTLTQVDEASRRSGPVTALAQLGYHIILAAGATLWVYSFNEAERLKPIAFWDAPFYVVSLRVIKSYVSVADAFRSVQFLRWYESDPMHTLELLGKSYESVPGAATASHYVIDPPTLAMLVADDRANVQVLQYDKTAVESRGGDRLLRRADFHLGYRISCLQGLRPVNNMGNRGMRVLVFGTIEGAAGALVPLEERTFRQLFALQGVMINALLHACALNPRAYRLFEPRTVLLDRRKKGFLDGELLWRYTALDAVTQEDLAGAVGTTREAVLDLLLEIDMLTWVM